MYLNDKKVAECRDNKNELKTNDEAQFAIDGYMGHSDGAGMTNITFTVIVPVKGTQIDLDAIIAGRQYVRIGMPINGKFQKVEGRIVNRTYTGSVKNGQAEGDFAFEGGEPTYA